ncbi:Wings apart-like protein [Penicillium citrinum]|uniref:Wings apart-like protein n=1 Tax=Penicillium citrinum TaxID=5077 RepID=A0A9W9NIY5_PENCI|nr:Wings apart-like protein [Penicillium citrinum]KAJ5220807.1 Wings apart-like protein [Penicillium citrinum]
MDSSRRPNRKTVTYGSSSRNQIPSNNIREDDRLMSLGKSPSRRLSRAEIARNENSDKRSRTLGISKAATTTGSLQETNDSIYDIPSSDDETPNLILQRKRKRAGLANNASQPQDPSPAPDGDNEHNAKDSMVAKSLENNSGVRAMTIARPNLPDRKGIQGQKRKTAPQQLSPKKAKTTLTYGRRANPGKLESSSEDELQREMEKKHNPQDDKSKGQPSPRKPASPSPQKSTETTPRITGNITPGRRRLVDALGTRERSIERASSNGYSESQLSSPIASQSPTRPRDTETLSVLTDSQREGLTTESTTAPSSHFLGSKVTYARQRSFLDDLNLEGGLTSGLEHDDLFGSQRSVEAIPRARIIEMDHVTNDDGAVRSIHELRQAGGNARYRSAIESIFEDIEDPHISVSGRCSALAQICSKLLDPKQARQFVECGFEKRIVDCLSSDLDVVSATLVFSALSLDSIGRTVPYIIATAAWPKVLETAPLLLAAQNDLSVVVRARENNLSKATQTIVRDVVPQMKSTFFANADVSKFSPCLIALFCLKAIISAFQEKGEKPPWSLYKLTETVGRYSIIRMLFWEQTDPEIITVILEAHTTSSSLLQGEYCDVLKSLSALHGLLEAPRESDKADQELQALYIRVILNVTNSSADLCDDLATPALVEALAEIVLSKFNDLNREALSQPEGISSLDTVILTLGTLINLAEQSEKSRVIFLNPSRGSQSTLNLLLHLFLEHVESTAQADSVPEVHHNVAVGYLAVLLLSLCLESEVRAQVKASLHPKGLSVVMSTVDEFMQYHQKIEQELHPMRDSDETSGFLGRLQDLVRQIKDTEG